MAKTFTSIKNPALQLTDQLPFGKFKGCRICDILEDDWEYLKWMKQNTSINFSRPVLDSITARFSAWADETHYNEEVAPYLNNDADIDPEDVPF